MSRFQASILVFPLSALFHRCHHVPSFTLVSACSCSARWVLCFSVQVPCLGRCPRRVLERRRGGTYLSLFHDRFQLMYGCYLKEDADCPLCLEEMDISDLNFKPCVCGYQVIPLCLWMLIPCIHAVVTQICRFCWHHIKENLNGRCPACRREYTDEAVQFKPIGKEEYVLSIQLSNHVYFEMESPIADFLKSATSVSLSRRNNGSVSARSSTPSDGASSQMYA